MSVMTGTWPLGTMRPGPGVRLLPGETAQARFTELVSTVTAEHLVMIPAPALYHQVFAAAGLGPGLNVRSLGVPAPGRTHTRTLQLIAAGAQHRELPDLPCKMVILGRKVAVTPVDPGNHDAGLWEITARGLVQRLVRTYERLWQRSSPPVRWIPADLSPRERMVVLLLAHGCTDEAVAEKLGLSRRTITYTVTDLMERYRARSRFQLALLLTEDRTPAKDSPASPLPATPAQHHAR